MGNRVRAVRVAPEPKPSGVIQKSTVWDNTLEMVKQGTKLVEVQIEKIPGLKNPTQAFITSLRRHLNRHYPLQYQVFKKEKIIYVKKVESG